MVCAVAHRDDGVTLEYEKWIKAVNILLLARSAGFFIDPNVTLVAAAKPTYWRQFWADGWTPGRMSEALRRFGDESVDPDGMAVRKAMRHALGLKDERRKKPREDD